jgi:hypothetical protein
VAEHRGAPEDVRAAVAVEREADCGRDRTLGRVGHEHHDARLPADEAHDVGGPGVPRPRLRDVDPIVTGHEVGARERAEEVREHDHTQHGDHGAHSEAREGVCAARIPKRGTISTLPR